MAAAALFTPSSMFQTTADVKLGSGGLNTGSIPHSELNPFDLSFGHSQDRLNPAVSGAAASLLFTPPPVATLESLAEYSTLAQGGPGHPATTGATGSGTGGYLGGAPADSMQLLAAASTSLEATGGAVVPEPAVDVLRGPTGTSTTTTTLDGSPIEGILPIPPLVEGPLAPPPSRSSRAARRARAAAAKAAAAAAAGNYYDTGEAVGSAGSGRASPTRANGRVTGPATNGGAGNAGPARPRPPRPAATSEGESMDEKRARFLERNRVAARKCRRRRKERMNELQAVTAELTRANDQLLRDITLLKDENYYVRTLLIEHKDCPMVRNPPIRDLLESVAKPSLPNAVAAAQLVPMLASRPAAYV